MFLSNARSCIAIGIVFFAICAGCASRPAENTATPLVAADDSGSVAFPTAEPENYRAEIIISAGPIRRTIAIAKMGDQRRIDYDPGTEGHRVFLHAGTDKILSPRLRVFAEAEAGGQPSEFETDFTENLLSRRYYSEIKADGSENGLARFTATIEQEPADRVDILVDPALGLPVRTEFYSLGADGAKIVRFVYELQNASLNVDAALFEIPAGYRRVTQAQFRKLSGDN